MRGEYLIGDALRSRAGQTEATKTPSWPPRSTEWSNSVDWITSGSLDRAK